MFSSTISLWLVVMFFVVVIGAGLLANLSIDGLKQLIPKLDLAPTVAKQVLAVVVALALGYIFGSLLALIANAEPPWPLKTLVVVLTVVVSQGIYRWKVNAALAHQGAATKEQAADNLAPRAVANTPTITNS